MSDYSACPHCGRRAEKAMTSNFFPVYRCSKCNTLHCNDCNHGKCPDCSSSSRNEVGKVYAR